MTLLHLLKDITSREALLPAGHEIGARLVCPEYSRTVQEVKTYPLLENDRLFALCWNIEKDRGLYATMRPSPVPFSYHYAFRPGEKTQLHTHDYLELSYVARGSFCQRISGRDITFGAGELCLIDKNCLHQDYLVNESSAVLFLGLANDMFTEIMDESITTRRIIAFLQSALLEQKEVQQYLHFKPGSCCSGEMEDCLCMLLRELCRHDAASPHICKGLMIRIFRLLSTEYDFSLSKEQQKTMTWVLFEEVTEYIRQHYASVTIQDLVRTFHYQEDYFNRLIKSKAGLTYSGYVQQVRLERAARLLISSAASIEDVADAVGYHNKGYFYKIFQERFGMTPRAYRKKNG